MPDQIFHLEDCKCGWLDEYANERYDTHEMMMYKLNPAHVLQRGCGTDGQPIHASYLNVLAYRVVCDRRFRTAAVVDALLGMVLHGYAPAAGEDAEYTVLDERRPTHRCAWETPLAGVGYALHEIGRLMTLGVSLGAEDLQIVQNVSGKFKEVLGKVAEDMDALREPGPVGDYRRNVVVMPWHVLTRDFDLTKDIVLDDVSMKVLLTCWIETAHVHRMYMNTTICMLLLEHDDPALPAGRHERAVEVIGARRLFKDIHDSLSDPKPLNRELELRIDTASCWLKAQAPLSRLWVHANVYDDVLDAMIRQRKSGDQAASLEVWSAGYTIFNEIDSTYWVQVATRLISKGALAIALHALCNAIDEDFDQQRLISRPYTLWLVNVVHVLTCPGPACDLPLKGAATPELQAACRAQLVRLYLPTLRRLRATRGRCKHAGLEVLSEFTDGFGITEASVRKELGV